EHEPHVVEGSDLAGPGQVAANELEELAQLLGTAGLQRHDDGQLRDLATLGADAPGRRDGVLGDLILVRQELADADLECDLGICQYRVHPLPRGIRDALEPSFQLLLTHRDSPSVSGAGHRPARWDPHWVYCSRAADPRAWLRVQGCGPRIGVGSTVRVAAPSSRPLGSRLAVAGEEPLAEL